ncbi:glycosyltransferase family 39 protein [Patescibacteria group bacterium]|nr:glycosyltransferase family 39 protein [Patescibacteria group bacterium]
MVKFFKNHKIEFFIFLLALLARILLFYINLEANGGNFENTIHGGDWYFEVSKNLFLGNGFSIDGLSPSPIHVPLYPLFLALSLWFFGSYKFAVASQIIIGALIPLIGRRVSLKLIPSEKVGIWVGIVLALEPSFILFSSIFITETLFISFFLLFAFSFISYLEKNDTRSLLLSSFLLGISALTKTAVQFFPVFLIPLAWWFLRKRLPLKKLVVHGALFISIFLLLLSPWVYRNYKEFGVPGMTIMPTFNFYAILVPSVLAIENNTDFASGQKSFINDRGIDMKTLTFATAPEFNKEALDVVIKYPEALMKVLAINALTFFTHDGMLTVLQNAGITPEAYLSKPAIMLLLSSPIEFFKTVSKYASTSFILVLVMRLFWVLLTISFLIGSFMLARKRKITASIAFALVAVLYFAITTLSNGLSANARFRMPVDPIILALAAYPFLAFKKDNLDF